MVAEWTVKSPWLYQLFSERWVLSFSLGLSDLIDIPCRLNENPSIGRKVAHHSGAISGSDSLEGDSDDEDLNNEMGGSRSFQSSARLSTPALSCRSRSLTPLSRASRSSTPLSRASRATTHSPRATTDPPYSQSNPSQSPALPQEQLRPLKTSNGSQYTPGVPFPTYKKTRTSRAPSSSIDPAMLQNLVSNSSQMIMLMMESNQERLDLMKRREQRVAEQHRSEVFAQRAQTLQQIVSNDNLPDEIRNEASQAFVKLLRGD